jgi:Fic family protein
MKKIDHSRIDRLLSSVDELKIKIDSVSEGKKHLWSAIHEKIRYSWTFNTNAIEGSTLTEGETIFFLKEGLTVEGKPFKDFADAKNHHEAIEYLFDFVSKKREISSGFIKEINALLLKGVSSTPAIDQHGNKIEKKTTPGEYKKLPNHVLQSDGTIHYYVEPLKVPEEIDNLVSWIKKSSEHPVVTAAVTHYEFVRIHPFDDGNGREARLLMNLILIENGFMPAVIKNEKRREYINSLVVADNGDMSEFIAFVAQSLIDSMNQIISEFNKNS